MTTGPDPCCGHRRLRARPSRLSWGALASGVALALLPKCPLCLAAYLTVLGVGTGAAASLARLLHPLTALLAVLVLALFIVRLARRAQRFAEARRPFSFLGLTRHILRGRFVLAVTDPMKRM